MFNKSALNADEKNAATSAVFWRGRKQTHSGFMPKINSTHLLVISKARKDKLDNLAFGASLVASTGYDVKEIRIKAALDRFEFARKILQSAEAIPISKLQMSRTKISRAYYSMYHALRAVTFFVTGGDDHEEHTVLPGKLPNDFPDRAIWENCLKTARLERNRADYDPYPKADKQFVAFSKQVVEEARALMPIVRQYLKSKGCS